MLTIYVQFVFAEYDLCERVCTFHDKFDMCAQDKCVACKNLMATLVPIIQKNETVAIIAAIATDVIQIAAKVLRLTVPCVVLCCAGV